MRERVGGGGGVERWGLGAVLYHSKWSVERMMTLDLIEFAGPVFGAHMTPRRGKMKAVSIYVIVRVAEFKQSRLIELLASVQTQLLGSGVRLRHC